MLLVLSPPQVMQSPNRPRDIRLGFSLSAIIIQIFIASCSPLNHKYSSSSQVDLESFQLPAGFRIELVASEPQIQDPVAMAFDEKGRLWVAEMGDYPLGKGQGRIKFLEDRDNDGYYETSSLFSQDISFPNGVMPYRSGVLVTAAPNILYLEDQDGDGKADLLRKVLQGFAPTNPQLRMNGLLYGLDNWIYGSYPRSGGFSHYPQFGNPASPLQFSVRPDGIASEIYPGMDFRFRSDQIETSGGTSQFGNAFDAWGNRFTLWNNDHIRHVVMDRRYLDRNPYLVVPSSMKSISDHGNAATLFPITTSPFHIHESEIGHFTSASGSSIYSAHRFPQKYQGAYFVCDPVHNLVHADRLTPEGVSFKAERIQTGSEFLASTDSWFRPVFTSVGPDSALYIVDFHRKLVEHPQWAGSSLQSHPNQQDFYAFDGLLSETDFIRGQEKGRIYRVVHESSREPPFQGLDSTEPVKLVPHLGHSNPWWRSTAQRLLIDQSDPASILALSRLASQAPTGLALIHALWTLEGLGNLRSEQILIALDHPLSQVRREGIRLSEGQVLDPLLRRKLLEMVTDPDSQVRFQLACTLGEEPDQKTTKALEKMVLKEIENDWLQLAVLSSATDNADQWLRLLFSSRKFFRQNSESKKLFASRVGSILGATGRNQEIAKSLALVTATWRPSWLRTASLEGLANGFSQRQEKLRISSHSQRLLLQLARQNPVRIRTAARKIMTRVELTPSASLNRMLRRARREVQDPRIPDGKRIEAIQILSLSPSSNLQLLEPLLSSVSSGLLQEAAVDALLLIQLPEANRVILAHWKEYRTSLKHRLIMSWLGNNQRMDLFLDALESKTIRPDSLSQQDRTRLLSHPNPVTREKAESLLDPVTETDRKIDLLKVYNPSLQLQGNSNRGRPIYEERCSSCHKVQNHGYDVGPDLLALTNRTRQYFMRAILDPSATIEPGYEEATVTTTDGRIFTGIVGEENSTSLTLRRGKGEEDNILRNTIAELSYATVSSMPEDLADGLSTQDMSDLLEYLKTLKQSK